MKNVLLIFIFLISCQEKKLAKIIAPENPLVIAHRGASALFPENTLLSVNQAWKSNSDAVEVDIYLCKDKKIVCLHDKNLFRTSGLSKNINELNYNEISKLDVGLWKDSLFKDEKIPLLTDILKTIDGEKKIFIEIKDDNKIIDPLIEIIEANENIRNNINIICFNYELISKIKSKLNYINAYWLIGKKENLEGSLKKTQNSLLNGISVRYNLIDKEIINNFHSNGLKVFAWTINNLVEVKRLKSIGIDGITTDRPGWLKNYLQNNIQILRNTHSHNDYSHRLPLYNALANGMSSIEIDIHLLNGQLFVSHNYPDLNIAKTIEEMYFKPLDSLIDSNGSWVYMGSPGKHLTIMIDQKTDAKDTYYALENLLRKYKDKLEIIVNDSLIHGPLKVIISGNKPIDYILNKDTLFAGIDGRESDLVKDYKYNVMPRVSASIRDYITSEEPSQEEINNMINFITKGLSQGKEVRFWGIPDNVEYWNRLSKFGEIMINADSPDMLYNYLMFKNWKKENEL